MRGYYAPSPRHPQQRIACFKGIAYGRDTAQTRFAAPQPPTPWHDVREATAWAPRAPQTTSMRDEADSEHAAESAPEHGFFLPRDEGPQSEDCLHLNVWSPAFDRGRVDAGAKLPVMFYIHGGAFANGTANAELYDGTRLAANGDVVVVTVNHRLNLFGYLYLAELLPGQGFEDSGNAGQLDLVLALQWVRDNIERFGGDPDRVMIFGQSGGGAKCATLMAQPPAKGLFQRVWTMSGQQVAGVEPAHATERAARALAALGIDAAKPAAAAQRLRTIAMESIQAAARRPGGYFGPVRDGRSLPVDPFAPTDPQQSRAIPMVLGNTHDETRFLMGRGRPDLFALTWETLPAMLAKDAPFVHSAATATQPAVSLPVAEVIAKYRAWHPQYSASDVFFAVTTDSRSWRGEIIEAEARARDAAAQPHTWVYQLNWRSPIDDGQWGAPHTLDIPLLFDNAVLAPGMVGASLQDVTAADRMAAIARSSAVAFAASGNPNCKELPHWPAFELEHRLTMIFDLPARVQDDPRGAERRYLAQVPYIQPGT